MDSTEANYKLTLYGLILGSVVSILGALSKCFLKSRCTSIKTPCVSIDRNVLDDAEPRSDTNSVYEDAPENFKSTPKLRV